MSRYRPLDSKLKFSEVDQSKTVWHFTFNVICSSFARKVRKKGKYNWIEISFWVRRKLRWTYKEAIQREDKFDIASKKIQGKSDISSKRRYCLILLQKKFKAKVTYPLSICWMTRNDFAKKRLLDNELWEEKIGLIGRRN